MSILLHVFDRTAIKAPEIDYHKQLRRLKYCPGKHGQPMTQSCRMKKGTIHSIIKASPAFPDCLRQIPQPPSSLYYISENWAELMGRPRVAIIGSRKVTIYGRSVTAQLAAELARAGVVVVSGLAYGIDSIAHRAVLEAGGQTIAVLAGGLDDIYPQGHQELARQIVAQGGALISEYPEETPTYKQHFIERNRIVSGLCRAVLITEAADKSGTIHTATFALEQGRDVLAVPGNITSPQSVGTNRLVKTGAIPITCVEDVFRVLDIKVRPRRHAIQGATPEQQSIINLLLKGETDGAALLEQSGLDVVQFNQALTMLEISGKIRSLGANLWSL